MAIFGELKSKIINLKGDDDDMEIMNNILTKDTNNIQKDSIDLIHCLAIRQFEFDENFIDDLRYKICNNLEETYESSNVEKIQIKIKNKITDFQSEINKYKNCNKNWPYCRNDSYFENVNQSLNYLVLSQKESVDVIEEYFFDISSINFRNRKDNSFYDIIVERRPHYCSEIIEEIKKERSSKNLPEVINENNMYEQEVYNDYFNKMMNNPQFQKSTLNVFEEFKPVPFFHIDDKKDNNNNIDNNNHLKIENEKKKEKDDK